MAFDRSPTQNRIIGAVAIGTAVSLFTLHFIFQSYFVHMIETDVHDKILPNTEVAALRAESEKRLSSGPMPLAQAVKQLGDRGRDGFAELSPKQSDDTRALVGWSKLPKPATDMHASTSGHDHMEHGAPAASGSASLTSAHVTPGASAAPAGSAQPARSAAPAHSSAPTSPASAQPAHGGAH